ncbi:MAG: NAD(P)H-dependent glycerol-3-phosphate dehydrogenase [Oceanococcaceae bacterium]
MPSALTVASADTALATAVAELFHGTGMRAYTSDDVIGVEVGGGVKNVIAIAVGAADGLGLGANTRVLLITRGLAEMSRLAETLGGRGDTMMGLAGMGDLVLTCTDDQSRNRRFGKAIGRGEDLAGAEKAIGQVVEGYRNAVEVHTLAQRHGVEMPISTEVFNVLHQAVPVREAFWRLVSRPQRAE